MATANNNFSPLPSTERDHYSESPLFARPNSPELSPLSAPELDGDIELDSIRQQITTHETESGKLASVRAEIESPDKLSAQIHELAEQLVAVKRQAGVDSTDAISNIDASVHVGEKHRLLKVIAGFFTQKPNRTEFELVEHRKSQLEGIVGALAGDQNKLMELNGSAAGF